MVLTVTSLCTFASKLFIVAIELHEPVAVSPENVNFPEIYP